MQNNTLGNVGTMVPPPGFIPTIKEAIEQAQDKHLRERIGRSRWKSIRASGLDDVCNRRLFYYLMCGELAKPIDLELQAIFDEGNDQEPVVRRYLSELGFEIMKAGLTADWPLYMISGKVDGTHLYQVAGEDFMVEIKTVSDYAWDTLFTAQDLLAIDAPWYRKWYGQMQIYLLLFEKKKGIFVLKRKAAKMIRIIEVELDYSYAEGLLKKAEIVRDAFRANEPPCHLKDNPSECKKCPFFAVVCNPPLNFSGSIQNIEDSELEKGLNRRAELASARSEYEKLDSAIKERLKEIPDAFVGNWHITGKNMTKKIKAQEAREINYWQSKIEKLEGDNSNGG